MHDLPDESDSEDDFDGYLGPDDGPIAYRSVAETQEEEPSPLVRYSRSLDDLTEIDGAGPVLTESPFASPSPSPSPMQGEHASGSPLARDSPSHMHTHSAPSSSTFTSQVKTKINIYTQCHNK